MLGGNIFRVLEKVTEKISQKILEHSGYATSWIGLSSWKGNWIQLKKKRKKETGGYLKVYFMPNNHFAFIFQLSFWLCSMQPEYVWYYGVLLGTDWLCYNSIHWVYLFLLRYTYRYNRSSEESANWQRDIVLLIKDNEDKVTIFQMKVFSYNCIRGTFLNPLT